jgi:hopanoid biosynthesis associated protein HpnK
MKSKVQSPKSEGEPEFRTSNPPLGFAGPWSFTKSPSGRIPPSPSPRRRLIVNADDFGRSRSINEAVIRAHPACAEAVALARENPRLGVGLHLTLLCGRSALEPAKIPGLVNALGQFPANPAGAGFRYFIQRGLREQLRAEIHAQFERFHSTGLPLDHINCHLHLHLHPVVFRILMDDAAQLGIRRVRLTFDPFWLNLRLARGRLACRALHALVFHSLSARARPVLDRRGFRHTRAVFGLLQNACVDESYVLNLLPKLPAGDSELYSHPSLDEFKNEFEALVSRPVRARVDQLGLELIRYQDL